MRHDFYFQQAKKDKYLSRAAYKLIEIQKKFKFIKNSMQILELGASPGSWSQVFIKNNCIVTAVDIVKMKIHHKNIKFFHIDIFENKIFDFNNSFSIIASDIALNSTGHDDNEKNIEVLKRIIEIKCLLKINGHMIIKTFHSEELKLYINILKKDFVRVKLFKPQASRKESSEIYILCEKYKVNS